MSGELKRPMYAVGHWKGPTRGGDVLVLKNGLWRHPDVEFDRPDAGFDDVFNVKTRTAVKAAQRAAVPAITATGNVGPPTWERCIWPHVDANRRRAYARFEPPVEDRDPDLVEPQQGFESLVRELWLAYAIGRADYGLLDGGPGGWSSGTFNSASRLPSGALSSHAKGPPARAFDLDLGATPSADVGWSNLNARAYFLELVDRHVELSVGYVILGTKIWSARRANEGIRVYTGGGHENHVHVNYVLD